MGNNETQLVKLPSFYFYTNILAPYMFHRWKMMASEFPGSLVVLTRRPDPERPWLYKPEQMDFPCKSAMETFRLSNQLAWSKDLPRVLSETRDKRVVHIIEDVSGLNVLTMMGLSRKSAFIMVNDGGFVETTRRPTQWLRWNLVGRRCFGVMTPGEAGRRYMLAWGFPAKRIYNSYLSHAVESFAAYRESAQAIKDKEEIRRTLEVKSADILSLCVSRLLDWKRLEDLAESIKYLPKHIQERLTLLLIGDGPHTAPLRTFQSMTDIRFKWISSIPYDDMKKYYAASNFLVLPSEGDIWGLVVNEALSMGKPVICTNRIGASELVKDNWNGFKVTVRSPKALAQAIEVLVENEQARVDMSNNAKKIEQTWHSGLFINGLKQIVRDLNLEDNLNNDL
jgi:glycosyltransferase involved in cell wall biosynthesis